MFQFENLLMVVEHFSLYLIFIYDIVNQTFLRPNPTIITNMAGRGNKSKNSNVINLASYI
ncbi:hypothetical protein GQ41_4318 [Arenibacter algicola]|uniref:Uncharacterized protein n=1 Tax=Arenibacter algicola TaxID=616991 RepID=A0ABY3AGR2_9FLAO